MAQTTASVSSIENEPSNQFKGVNNVIDLPLDEKLKLQLEVKEIKKHLEELKDATVTGTIKKLDDTYKDLFDINKNNTLNELKNLQGNVETEYKQLQKSNTKVKSLDEIQKTVSGLVDKIGSQKIIDKFAEDLFDDWALRNDKKYPNTEDLETAFNHYMQTKFADTLSAFIDGYKEQEISNVLKNYRFELENLEGYTFVNGTNDLVYEQERGFETEINTEDIKRQHESQFVYAKISDADEKEIVDNYKRKGKDNKKALQKILNTLKPKTKEGISNINQNDFVAILEDLIDEKFLSGIEDIAGSKTGIIQGDSRYANRYNNEKYQEAFKDAFKDQFQKEFVKTGRYEKSGPDVLQLFENGKIADIIFAYQTGKDAELINDFHRLISQYKNDVHFTGGWNAEYLLKKKVGVESTFKFLCDFNSDGKVDGGKEAKDVGAVMGIQLYENLLDAGTVKYDEDKKEYILVDGEETSNMIEHILLSVASSTTINDKLKTAIDFFLSSKKKELTYTVKDETGEKPKTRKEKMEINTGRDASGNISIENFLSFMKGEFVYKENVNEDEQKAIDEKLKTTAGYDIKEYLRVNGDKLNAKRDMAEIFLDPEEIANRTREASRDFYEATENIKDSYRRVIANEQIEKSNVDRGRMKNGLEKFADSDIAAAKNSIVDKMAIVAMTITDHIFFNLGDNTEAWINMFGGALGAISSTWFKDKESITRNKKEIKNALGKYILSRMMPNISLSAARNANGDLCPVIGVSVGIDRLVSGKNGKSNRRGANAGLGFLMDLANIKDSRFIFSVGAEKARQTKKNQATVQDLSKKYLLPVNRIGVEGGFGLSLKNASPYVGVFCERDPISGIRQSEEIYQSQMDKILFGGGPAFNIFSGEQQEVMPIYTDRASFVDAMKAKIDEKNPNKTFLEEEVDQLADLMERGGTFSLMQDNKLDIQAKKQVLKYVYMAYIEGAKENASAQKTNELDKQRRLTRMGARFNVKEVLKVIGGGAATGALGGSVVGPRGTVIGSLVGATAASLRFSRYENKRKYDVDKGLFNYKTIGNMHALKEKKADRDNIETYAQSLEHEVNGRIKYISVTGEEKDKKGTMTFSKNVDMKGKADVLQYMNVYYSDEAMQSGAFSYDGANLVLGKTEFSTYKVINKDSVEVFLMIGNNKKGPLKQLTKADKNMSEVSVHGIEKVPTKSAPMTAEKLKTLKAVMPTDGDQITLDALNKAYLESDFLKNFAITDLVNGKIIATRNSDGTFSFALEQLGPDMNAAKNKVELIYDQKIIIPKENGGGSGEWKSESDVEMFFDITQLSELKEAKTILQDVEKGLENLEWERVNGNAKLKDAYLKFMVYMANLAEGEQTISSNQIDKAVKELESSKMLGVESFSKLLDVIKNGDYITKSWVLDELKSVFAKEARYSSKKIGELKVWRPDAFATTLYGPSKEKISDYNKDLPKELKEIKDKLFTDLKDEPFKMAANEAPNIIGYTAYYREGKTVENKNQRYSITGLGETTTQGDAKKIERNDGDARKWFIGNLEKNEYEVQLLAKIVEKKTGLTFSKEQVIKLLESPKGTIVLEKDKKEITIESSMVFYLAGSCANESIGLKINKITAKNSTNDGGNRGDENGQGGERIIRYEGGIAPDASEWKYNADGIWRDGTLNSTYEVRTKERGIGVTAKGGPKKQADGAPNPEGTAGEGRDPSNPNGNLGGGEGQDPGNGTFGQSGSEGP